MSLTKEVIFALKPKLREVNVPEWGGSICIRPLTLKEQADLSDRREDPKNAASSAQLKNVLLPALIYSVVDENGKQIFSAEDADKLMNSPASVFMKLQDEILEFSGLTKESREKLEKNLPTPPNSEPGT